MESWLSWISDLAKEKPVIKTWWQLIRDIIKRNQLQGSKKHMGSCATWGWWWGSWLHQFTLWLWTGQCSLYRLSVPQGNSTAICTEGYSSLMRVKECAPHLVSALKHGNNVDFPFCEAFSALWIKTWITCVIFCHWKLCASLYTNKAGVVFFFVCMFPCSLRVFLPKLLQVWYLCNLLYISVVKIPWVWLQVFHKNYRSFSHVHPLWC